MAQITNPEAIRFVNEQIRPLCERARALKAEIAAMQTNWYGGLNGEFDGNGGADTVEDGREAEGVSRLIGGEVTNAVAQLFAVLDLNAEIIAKPCVRALQVS